jgi:sugar phosphate isomerase/epimerase
MTIQTRREFTVTAAAALGALAVAPSRLVAGDAGAKRWPIVGFTKPFQNLDFEAIADTVVEIGWDGIECPVRPKDQIEPERVGEDLPKLVDALKQRGKTVAVLATAITSVSQPHAARVLRTAVQLGIKRYRLGFWHYDRNRSIQAQLPEIVAQLRDLAALNRELGLQAGFENHSGPNFVGAPVWDLWTALQAIDPREVGVCFDIGHATVEGGTAWPLHARLMVDRFTTIIVKDFVWQRSGKGWEPQWTLLGEGMVSSEFFRWLKTTNFAGPIVQHHEYDHGAGAPMIARMRKDLRVLREWLAE